MSFLKKVIKVFTSGAIDQENKGIQKYGRELDPLSDYDWLQMAQEELVDGFKYHVAERQKRNYHICEALNYMEIALQQNDDFHSSNAIETAKTALLKITKDVKRTPNGWVNATYFTEELEDEVAAAKEYEENTLDWLSPSEQKELQTVPEFNRRAVYQAMILHKKKHADRLGFFSMTMEQMMEAGTIKNRARLRQFIQELENEGKVKVIAEGRTSRYMLPALSKLKDKSE